MFDDDKRHPFESKMTEEQLKLLQAQMALEKDTGQSFSFLPLNETLTKCVLVGQSSKASKIKSDFKVPEKRFWWIQVRVFIQVSAFLHDPYDLIDLFEISDTKLGKLGEVYQDDSEIWFGESGGGSFARWSSTSGTKVRRDCPQIQLEPCRES